MSEIKITAADAGTWLDGNQGWTNAYRVIDRAEAYGFVVPEDYADALAAYRTGDADDDDSEAITGQGELSDMATDYLEERAPEGYTFLWDAGELSLVEEWVACAFAGAGCTEDKACADHADNTEAEYEHTTHDGYTAKISKVGGGTLGRAYEGDWEGVVTRGGHVVMAMRDFPRGTMRTGTPHTHAAAARLAVEIARGER